MTLRAAIAILLVAMAAAPARPEPVPADATREDAGAYRDRDLAAYVRRVGERLVAAAGQSRGRWSFTVLDTPDANAFALPGRRILVTRGMLALANDEAELAVVLGHEIGHAVAGHGQRGGPKIDRRAAELEADRLGMDYVARAGYDPFAQVDFLQTLLASRALEAELRGRDPALAPPLEQADHPALAERLRQARAGAGRFGKPRGGRERPAYLAAIDGLVWGDGPAQGFVRGRSFVHPDLRFAFDGPPGYALANRPDVVAATGPRGALLLLDSLPDPGGDPAAYLADRWVPEIARGVGAGRIGGLRRVRLNGLAAAQAQVPLATADSERVAELTVIRYRGRLYRLTGLHAPGDTGAAAVLAAAVASFRPLSAAEAARMGPLHIRIHRIARGDDLAALARSMPVGAAAQARFDLLNGLSGGSRLRVGDQIKLVED